MYQIIGVLGGFEVGGLNCFDFLCCFATTLKLKYQRFELHLGETLNLSGKKSEKNY
jgi:hypothetical protein